MQRLKNSRRTEGPQERLAQDTSGLQVRLQVLGAVLAGRLEDVDRESPAVGAFGHLREHVHLRPERILEIGRHWAEGGLPGRTDHSGNAHTGTGTSSVVSS